MYSAAAEDDAGVSVRCSVLLIVCAIKGVSLVRRVSHKWNT